MWLIALPVISIEYVVVMFVGIIVKISDKVIQSA